MTRRLLLFVSTLTVACASASHATPTGDDASSPNADASTTDAPSDAPPAYVTCASPDTLPPTAACGSLAWAKSPVAAARPRNHHLTEIVQTASGPFLYEIGGVNANNPFANVDRAPIAGDGSLGAWVSQSPLPSAVGGLTGGVVSNVIVYAGGVTGFTVTGSTIVTDQAYSAVIADDGTVGAWKSAGSVLKPRMHAASFVNGSTIYILGGFEGTSVWQDAVSATVQPDGTVSAWQPAGQMAAPRSHFSVVQVGDRIFTAGGVAANPNSNTPCLADVYGGSIQSDGTLGGWSTMPSLPEPLCTHASFFYGGYVYIVGGIMENSVNAELSSAVYRAAVQADGSLAAWAKVHSLPIARGHVHQVPMFENHVYSVGGAIDFNLDSTTQVDIGTFQ